VIGPAFAVGDAEKGIEQLKTFYTLLAEAPIIQSFRRLTKVGIGEKRLHNDNPVVLVLSSDFRK
jgi:crotonobetainyl-CoA:carnitine CoA-transferase CaiB-like acyl-CoA transferase